MKEITHKIDCYVRKDGKWEWRITAANGNIVATSGSQGYNNQKDCEAAAENVCKAVKFGTLLILWREDQLLMNRAPAIDVRPPKHRQSRRRKTEEETEEKED